MRIVSFKRLVFCFVFLVLSLSLFEISNVTAGSGGTAQINFLYNKGPNNTTVVELAVVPNQAVNFDAVVSVAVPLKQIVRAVPKNSTVYYTRCSNTDCKWWVKGGLAEKSIAALDIFVNKPTSQAPSASATVISTLPGQEVSNFSLTGISQPRQDSSFPLSYSLPTGWKTVRDSTQALEVGYDPNNSQPSSNPKPSFVDILRFNPGKGYGFNVKVQPYGGKDLHQFIYQQLGVTDPTIDRMSGYHEKEYVYKGSIYDKTGWRCLVLYGFGYSAYGATVGACSIDANNALLIISQTVEEKPMEQIISAINFRG